MAYIESHVNLEGGGAFRDHFSFPHNFQESYNFQDHEDPMMQLENARLNRSGYYKRMEQSRGSPLMLQGLSPVRDGNMSSTVVVREKGISEGGPSEASLPRVPEPHPSWRFYTSYDNGEWKRHMVPVYHSEKDVLNTSPGIGTRSPLRSESSFQFEQVSPTLESNIRRTRLSRPSVYECLQNRRQRVSAEHKTLQGPRSAETILNSMEYLPAEAIRKRYNYDNYSPKRRTEYGERVIYPRVKTDSMSSGDLGFKKISANVSEEDEVTRSVHPSCLQVDSTDRFEASKAEGRPPSSDYNSREKIIIPTKYKQGFNTPTMPAKTILDMVDEPRVLMSPHKERVILKRAPSPSFRRSNNFSPNYITSSDDSRMTSVYPQRRSRSREVGHPSVMRPQELEKDVKILLVNPSVKPDQYVTTVNVGNDHYNYDERVKYNNMRPKSKNVHDQVGSSQSKEILIQNQQPQQTFRENQQQNNHKQQTFQQQRQQPSYGQQLQQQRQHLEQPSSRGSENIAGRVKANTMATVQQMQDLMLNDMKNTCPQAAETMGSLLSGRAVEGASVESKQTMVEQSNMWQRGKPMEGRVSKESRVFSNDPVSGPQDFVERSSISQNLSEMPDGPTFIQHPFLQMSETKHSNLPNNSMRMELSDHNRYPSSVFFTPEPTTNDKPQDYLKNPNSYNDENKRSQQLHEYISSSSNNFANNSKYGSSNTRSDEDGCMEKIIIPTKYKENAQESRNDRPSSSSRNTFRSGGGGGNDVSRSFKLITSPGSSDVPDGNSLFQKPQQARRFENPTSHNMEDSSTSNRSGNSSRSNFNYNSVGNNKNVKDWSFEMALKEAD